MVEQVISSIAALAAARLSRWAWDRPSGSATRSSGAILPAVRSATNSRTRDSSSLAASSVKVTAAMDRGRDAFGEHHGDAAGHDGGLARTRAGLDQDRAIMEADRIAAGAVVLQHFGHAAHHSASQT